MSEKREPTACGVPEANAAGVGRRDFLAGSLWSAAAGGAAWLAGSAQPTHSLAAPPTSRPITPTGPSGAPDYTTFSAALQPDEVKASACQFCNALCRLNVQMKQGRIIGVTGEQDDPVQRGELCVKAEMMTQLVYNPRRLTQPLKRISGAKGDPGSQFAAISWEEALTIIAKKFLALRDAGEAHTIANRTTGRMGRGVDALVGRLFTLLGSPNNADVGPVCNDAGGNALGWTFGLGNFTNGYGKNTATNQEDLGAAKYLFFLGTNQAETHPVTFSYLLRHRAQTKAHLTVVDPRKTPTVAQADTWLAPKPHTDLALVLGMLSVVVDEGLYDKAFVSKWVLGFEELKAHLKAKGYTPQWAASRTDLPVSSIQKVAREFAKSRPAAIFCNAGISHQLNAFATYRALAILSAITGNVGVHGGGCNFMHNTWPGHLDLPALKAESSKKAPKKKMGLPVGPDAFAASILDGVPYKLKALVTQGNPLLSAANTTRVKSAFKALEFYVYTGLFMEEPAYYADVILPVCSGFEQDGVYMRRDDRAIRWQEQVVAPVGQSRPDSHIWIDLAHTLAKNDKVQGAAYWADAFPQAWKSYSKLWSEFAKHTPGVGGMGVKRLKAQKTPLQWPCPNDKHPGVSTLYLDHPSWYKAVAALQPGASKRFLTPSGKVEVYTPAMQKKLAAAGHHALPTFFTHPEVKGNNETLQYQKKLVPNPLHPGAYTPLVKVGVLSGTALERTFPLMGMIGRPSVVHFASVTHWTYQGKLLNGVRLIQIHPKAAKAAGIKQGDTIWVESPRGKVKGTALLWDGIREDTIFVPNTFGPQQATGRDLGVPLYEAANTLVDDQYFDTLSGQQAYKCFACRIKKA